MEILMWYFESVKRMYLLIDNFIWFLSGGLLGVFKNVVKGKFIFDYLKNKINDASKEETNLNPLNMFGIMFEKINNKIKIDNFNWTRSAVLNIFDAGTLEFGMDNNKKMFLINEGYEKTIKKLFERMTGMPEFYHVHYCAWKECEEKNIN